MTCREKLAMEHPDRVDDTYYGGCVGCPSSYGYIDFCDRLCDDCTYAGDENCTKCWNQEVKETEPIKTTDNRVKRASGRYPWGVEKTNDMVNHPGHYMSETGLETIDVIEAFTFDLKGIDAVCTANVLKYICRWNKKNGLQDLEKAKWYLNHLIEHVKKLEEENDQCIEVNIEPFFDEE